MTNLIHAPWTAEQVTALNAFQHHGRMHPFTCGAEHASGRSPVLIATNGGWVCPDPQCVYRQDWAHAFMVERGAAVSAAVAPPTNPTHGLSVPHADALWDAVAIPGPRTPTYPEQHERVCRAVRDILDELTPARDDTVARTALRDRIRLAIARQWLEEMGSDRTADELDDAEFGSFADAVLAVLPEPATQATAEAALAAVETALGDTLLPDAREEALDRLMKVLPTTDRAAVLRDFVRQLTDRLADCCTECDACAVIARDLADAELRRMADEEQPAAEAPAVPVHACPGPDDAGRMPCCGRPPHETLAHRITVHTHHVTCTGPTK